MVYEENQPLQINEYRLKEPMDEWDRLHWHDDFEMVQILRGILEYRINDDFLNLQSGDCLFINSRVMHSPVGSGRSELHERCLLYHPSVLSSNQVIQEKYISPVSSNNAFEYIYIPRNTPGGDECARLMNQIYDVKNSGIPAYEMDVLACLHLLMAHLYRYVYRITPIMHQKTYRSDLEKRMLSLIYHKYSEKLTLEDIAAAAGISTHRCCRIFRQSIGTSPIEYLNTYRIEVAARMLLNSDISIQTIANSCGIDSAAYFTKQFKAYYHMTPREYRSAYRKTGSSS